ncbi:MAG TPA: 23S rRNA (guanosine(2251)-2'-O)-methyltransferase RlmB [Polyangiales bacterium]|jgi:23S rRNA (guanosine2251-2'-O)-methyltransferase|nr:23S rRNA (guanosine(2251)-2'-O)-methyltransferase RlmB [Polyangiales bacterium]
MTRVVLGPRAVEEALRADARRIAVIYAQPEGTRFAAIEELARRANVRFEPGTNETLDALAKGARHQGIAAIAGEYEYVDLEVILQDAEPRPLLVALDQISDPHNFGAIVRSAVAFGADGVVTLKDRASPVTPVVVRASAGATERARIARVTNLARSLDLLKRQGLQLVGLDAEGGVPLHEVPYPVEGRVLVIGSEGHGLRRLTREACDALARIDMSGPIASLNASVAASIALYESARARGMLRD